MPQRRRKPKFVFHKQDLWIFGLVLVVPLLTLGVARLAHEFEHRVIVAGKVAEVFRDFNQEAQTALNQVQAFAAKSDVQTDVRDGETTLLTATLQQQFTSSVLTRLAVADKDGAIVTRVPSFSIGDFIFQSAPWGAEVAEGKPALVVGSSRNYPLAVSAVAPVLTDGKVDGAIIGGYSLDDDYAKAFKTKYLQPDEEIAFYCLPYGVHGMSFGDPTAERTFKTLFSSGSNAVQSDTPGLIAGHFNIGGTVYHVSNITLRDDQGHKVGGIFVLIPADTGVPPITGGVVGASLIIPLGFHIIRKHKGKWLRLGILAGVLVVITGSVIASVETIRNLLYRNPPPNTIYNSTISFSPDADIYSGLTQQKIDVHITTGGENINAAEASISFDPKQVRVDDVLMDLSFCDPQLTVEKTIDNVAGKVKIACIKPGGIYADQTTLAELLIQPLAPGEVDLHFDDSTEVLANDGLGTNVLRTVTNGAYEFVTAPTHALTLFSYTHPNASRWYDNARVHVAWADPDQHTQFAYLLDQLPGTAPSINQTTTQSSLDLTTPHDGTYYLHVAPIIGGSVGPVSTLRVLIDTTPPSPPEIDIDPLNLTAGQIARLKFSDRGDALSGLQKNFYIRFDDGTWFPTGTTMDIPFLQSGEHTISLRVFDNAGNYSDTLTRIVIR